MYKRNPNTECSICKFPLYRRPSDKIKCPESFCKDCYSTSDHSRRSNQTKYLRYINEWKNDLQDGMSGKTSISSHIRRYLFMRSNNQCELCGWNQINSFTNRIPLEINHKDGNFMNNKEENLELICPNCHSLTSSYRSLNIGKGRPRN